jgi:hypothetical protein
MKTVREGLGIDVGGILQSSCAVTDVADGKA